MIDLELFLVIGKGRTGDFTVLFPAHLSITSESARLPASWLQHHAAHSAQRSVSLWRQDDRVMLGCAWQESGVDSAGRPLQKLAVYAADKPPPDSVLARLALWLHRQNFDGGRPPPHHEVAPISLVDDETPLIGEERDCGAAALALLEVDACRAQNTRTAQGIVDALGFDQIGFLALVPNAVPSWPEVGPGVVLSRSPWRAPLDAVRFVAKGLRPGALDLAGLMRMPRDRARRKALACAVLTGDCVALGRPSDQELDWLVAHQRTRGGALTQASAEQIARLVGTGATVNLDDLAPEQLAKLPRSSVVAALRGRRDAVARFVAIFGRGTAEVVPLLPEHVASLLSAAHSPVDPQRLLDLTADDLDLMEQAGVFETMSLRWIAALRAIRPRPPVDKHLARRLRELLPDALVARLLGATGDDVRGTDELSKCNPPEPRAEWLAGIPFERLVDAGALCVGNRAWRRWWTDALVIHPGSQGREIASLTAPWSRATSAWLVASARDGDILPADVCGRIAAFMAARAPIDPSGLAELLVAAGVTNADAMADLVHGRAPQCVVDERFAADVRYLYDAGILSNDALQAALQAGLPLSALSKLAADEAAITLLNELPDAPTHPPTSWHPLLTQALRQRMQRPGFWKRWRGGVPATLLDWMRLHVEGEPEATIIDSLVAARQRSRRLGYDELLRLSGGLAPLDLAWQIVENSRDGSSDRGRFLRLLDDCGLRTELVRFLRSELGTLAPAAPPPEFTVPEMLAVHPLLDPVRDVVRRVMSLPSLASEEDSLLALTIAAIRRTGYGFPLPPPSAEQAARRPTWVAALAELAGWEHWRQV